MQLFPHIIIINSGLVPLDQDSSDLPSKNKAKNQDKCSSDKRKESIRESR